MARPATIGELQELADDQHAGSLPALLEWLKDQHHYPGLHWQQRHHIELDITVLEAYLADDPAYERARARHGDSVKL